MIKYADDIILTGKISFNDETHYRNEIDNFVQWCNHLSSSQCGKKTKENIFFISVN